MDAFIIMAFALSCGGFVYGANTDKKIKQLEQRVSDIETRIETS